MNEDIPLISDQASPSGMIVFKRPLTEIEGYTIRKLQLDGCSAWAIAMAFPPAIGALRAEGHLDIALTTSPLTVLAQEDFAMTGADSAESRRIAPVPSLRPAELLEPGEAVANIGDVQDRVQPMGQHGLLIAARGACVRRRAALAAASALAGYTRRLGQESGDVLGGLGFDAGLLQEAEIAEPVDKAELPGAERDGVAVG